MRNAFTNSSLVNSLLYTNRCRRGKIKQTLTKFFIYFLSNPDDEKNPHVKSTCYSNSHPTSRLAVPALARRFL